MNGYLPALFGLLLLTLGANPYAFAQASLAQPIPTQPAVATAVASVAAGQSDGPSGAGPQSEVASSRQLQIGGATLQIDFAPGSLDLPQQAILDHIEAAAKAVTAYFGQFPVKHARILVVPVAGGHDEIHGTTWGDMHGFPGFTRLSVGEHTTAADLADDWVTTHELVHMAFPSLPREQHWMEEGLATYIEPIARVQTGELQAKQIWQDMVHGMPQGEPGPADQGMDRTHTWGRTYWGGALFCLVADIEIRRETGNRKGLQDALQAVVAAGGTINNDWPLMKALEIGDQATGTHVLTGQYAAWKDASSPVDLQKIWAELGVRAPGGGVPLEFDATAPLANIREAITTGKAVAHPAGVSTKP